MSNVEIVTIKGIVLSSFDFQDTSVIMDILTENELISVIAKGAKRLKNKLRPFINPLVYGEFTIYKKREGLSTLIEASSQTRFKTLEKDPKYYNTGIYLANLSRSVLKEDFSPLIYQYLIASLNRLNEGFKPNVILNIIETKYLSLMGIEPDILNIESIGYNLSNRAKKVIYSYQMTDLNTLKDVNIMNKTQDEINLFLKSYYEEYSGIYLKNRDFLLRLIK